MKSRVFLSPRLICLIGLLSGCSGNDTGPILPPSGSAASTDDQRAPQSDALTSQEAALVSQAHSEPDPAPKTDL
ncbi:MAG: hypothetical protein K2Q17_11420 [Nitrospiraceae bacterium]|jgi:hypothetical protein|uniref:hypothetical protein n=1 Tax=Nitrospira cf. moscoviensis SBR1015 TaxID=96242 RepID=UPI000A0E94E3|nr:hypothetical protein [Nitrospira cf. moscoviensis SBR1015]MBY0248265.1 hypothetical protein [Nitrospiraceae bacterium]OQW37375.1 MAG: hypothetical protein A4E20_05155 [Nitrospira sp. SG-bin2]